jgi:hypothetical protein
VNKRAFAVVIGLFVIALVAACEDQPAASLQTPGQAAAQTPLPVASASDPSARESVSANPSFDQGHTVHITQAGLQPLALVSFCCDPIVFKNETGAPVSVTFNISKASSGPIAPGATWKWTPPNPESVIYHLGANPNQSGQIQIESPNW